LYGVRAKWLHLDRIDIQIEVPRLSEDKLLQSRPGESSRDIRKRVKRARFAQAGRFKSPPIDADPPADPLSLPAAQMTAAEVREIEAEFKSAG
jgi:predicted ATPase with chaperone activity